MNKIRMIIKICLYELKIQIHSKRVVLGYLVGIVVVLKQAMAYILYANEVGMSVNVLESFIITGNNYNTIMFMVLGWLFIISEAPFVNNNSVFLIHRTDKKSWNQGMISYIVFQGLCYYALIALTCIVISIPIGYLANIWSNALVNLSSGAYEIYAVDVYFPHQSFMKEISVFGAFGVTWSLCFLYGISLAMILYVFNLFSNQIWGVIMTFFFHFLNYEMMKEGYMVMIKYSLLARSVPLFLIGNDLGVTIGQSYGLFILLIAGLIIISNRFIQYVDYKELAIGE